MLRIAPVALSLLVGVSGCTKLSAPDSRPNAAVSTLVIADTFEPATLNPLLAQGQVASLLGSFVFSHLLSTDHDGRLIPEVAIAVPSRENRGISADGLRVTYHLRRDVRWQDGVPLTAADCAFTLRAIMNPRNNIASRSGYDEIVNLSTPDRYTVELSLRTPFSPITGAFLASAANYPIIPEHLLKSYRDLNSVKFNGAPVGSGPYRVIEWKRGDHVTFGANPSYFNGKPRIDRIIDTFVPSSSTMLNQLKTHEIDAAFVMDPALRGAARSIPGYRVVVTVVSGITTLMFNLASGPTVDPVVRKAITRSLNVPRIVRDVSGGEFTSRDALRGIFGWAYHPLVTDDYDPRAAMRMLEAGGWHVGPDGVRVKGQQRLSLLLIMPNDRVSNGVIATVVQQELAAIGAEVSIRGYTPLQYGASAAAGGPVRSAGFSIALIIMFGSAGPDATELYACDQRAPAGSNFERLCDAEIDALLKHGRRTYDREARVRDAAAVQVRLQELAAQIDLFQTRRFSVIPKALRDYEPTPDNPYNQPWKWSLDAK